MRVADARARIKICQRQLAWRVELNVGSIARLELDKRQLKVKELPIFAKALRFDDQYELLRYLSHGTD